LIRLSFNLTERDGFFYLPVQLHKIKDSAFVYLRLKDLLL
jgi:hypothetical protein